MEKSKVNFKPNQEFLSGFESVNDLISAYLEAKFKIQKPEEFLSMDSITAIAEIDFEINFSAKNKRG